ncbi:hypothetical protein ACQ4PT_036716 [Festuca glaucescens]
MAAEGDQEWLMASEEEEEELGEFVCIVRDCACYWHSFGSPRTPRVAPGRDYHCMPAGANHSPTWSLLVGVMQGAVLRLKRLRVALSGRILGRSDDALESFHDIDMPTGCWFSTSAALAPDGRSLCVLHQAYNEKPRALQLTLQPHTNTEEPATSIPLELHLPEIEAASCSMPISAGHHLWALSAIEKDPNFSLLMRRLVPGDGWQQVGHTITRPYVHDQFSPWGSWFLQGYAVLPDAALILVSFNQDGLFFTFAPDSGDWTLVPMDATRSPDYVPILGRGVYIEQDKAVYMIRNNTIYAYNLTCYQDDQGRQQLGQLDPPITIDSVCPFNSCQGYGFLTRLDHDRLMCSVWISLGSAPPCHCGNLHAMPLPQGGIQVLHSSFRRVDMVPNPRQQEFCFLLEYEDKDSPVLLQHHEGQEDLTSSQDIDHPSKMLDCCRQYFTPENDLRMCFLCGGDGHIARECSLPPQQRSSAMPPWGPTHSMLDDPASVQRQVSFSSRPAVPLKPATTTIKNNLFIICQIGSQPVIYPTGVMDESLLLEGDNGVPLEPRYSADDGDDNWHFIHSGSKIHAVSCIRDFMLEFNLNKDRTTIKLPVRWPSADPFVMVIRVGGETIALTDSLEVFHQKVSTDGGSTTWLPCKTDQLHVLRRKVVISGYVQVTDHSFLLWDAVTGSCLLFDLGAKQWRVVMPWAAFNDRLPRAFPDCFLNGRCVFVDGFIYTCRDGGLAAYQLLHKDHSIYLSQPIFLPFSWLVDCVGDEYDVCLDYAGKDVDSGAILFYVVQGGYSPPKHDVQITIVQVKTKRTPSNGMKPVRAEPVDRITRSFREREPFHTRCCFAVSF